jgi:proline dehydrogenase
VPIAATVRQLPRSAILHAADSARLQALVQRHGMRLGAARFVAGETLDECVAVLRRLNEAGLHANTTLLGESTPDEAGAEAVTRAYEEVLDRLVGERLRANVALKLTHLGLDVDGQLAFRNVERLVARAERLGTFVRIDMEHSAVVDVTLDTYRRLREQGHTAVGVVLQSYLRRSEADLEGLLPLRPNVRIVKGAYLEPPEVAFADKPDVDRVFLRLVERALEGGAHVAVATHDEAIVEHVKRRVAETGVGRDRFEFQMLYGVRSGRQQALAAEGYKVLVATPYGPDWFPYLMRRLAERPANLGFVLRNAVRR